METTRHCMVCKKQLHRNSRSLTCETCVIVNHKKKCDFCKETNCAAWGSTYFKSIDKKIYVDFRADMEFNQIDCQFGLLDENGLSDEATWSDFAININYCPICGRELPPVE